MDSIDTGRKPRNPRHSIYLFFAITLLCALVAIVYVARAARQPSVTTSEARISAEALEEHAAGSTTHISTAPFASPLPAPPISPLDHPDTDALAQIIAEPFLVSTYLDQGPDIGRVQISTLGKPTSVNLLTDLRCERVYFANGKGICLRREIDNLSVYTAALLFDNTFRVQQVFDTDGVPSRARISPDGRYAALTVFVLGHSYADSEFSTATILLNTETGNAVANLEDFTVYQNNKEIDYPDFNYWGVTFTRDANIFYATLRFNRTPYLVRGDITKRTITILYTDVECPSLSPDETRIVYKKMTSPAHWQLTVMDLETFDELPLAEARSVDDQAEWLDNQRILYVVAHPIPPPLQNIFVVPADGSGEPQLFLAAAGSPVAVRLAEGLPLR